MNLNVNSVNSKNKSKANNRPKFKSIKRKRRVYGNKHKTRNNCQSLTFFSCNAANIKNKLLSLEKVVNYLKLSLFCLQESHVKKVGSIKLKSSNNFQIYEKVRDKKGGGGLAIGIEKSLNPAWIRDGGDEVEAMTIKFSVQKFNIRIVNAYGLQEYDDEIKKHSFWKYIDDEIHNCNREGSGILIFMDANSWLGPSWIKNYPHSQK